MYRQKSEIIGQIQSYHRQVAQLYSTVYERVEEKKMKSLLSEMLQYEKSREQYLERHKRIAEAMNCWLDFPCDKLSDQISECFKVLNLQERLTMEDLLRIQLHFDDCLIKLYNILASENALSESAATIFYYMLRKTEKEKNMLAGMLHNSGNGLNFALVASQL
jgi:hypothetical protein